MATTYAERKRRIQKKLALRQLLEERIQILFQSENPTFGEYINLDFALRCSGVFTDIDRIWVLWSAFAEKNGWSDLVNKICTMYCN